MSEERKYTDRDVRENQNFYLMAIDYLEKYEGEFDYLIDMKMRLAVGRELTVPMVRGVLNCMRNDPRIESMPEPEHKEYGTVIQMPKRSRKNEMYECPLAVAGVFHHHKRSRDMNMLYCPGLYRINRKPFWTPARIHPDVMVIGHSAATLRVHKVDPDGEHRFEWYPPPHEYGEAEPLNLHVKLACIYPRWLKNPYLLREDDFAKYNEELAEANSEYDKAEEWKADESYLFKCERCFGNG